MEGYILVWFFVFGALVGSFLNVVAYRFNTGKSLGGRSHCTTCGETLGARELVPVFSYLLQRGRCRFCHARVSARYILGEALTGFLFALVAYGFLFDPVSLVLNLILAALLVVIFMYDIRHLIIPNVFVYALCVVAVSLIVWDPLRDTLMMPDVLMVVGGVLPALIFAALWYVSGGKWVGLGDAKLAFPLGLILDLWGSISMFILSFWIGAVISVAIILFRALAHRLRGGQLSLAFRTPALTMKSEVPFAPFLIGAFFLVHLFGADVWLMTDAFISFVLPH